MNDQLIAGFTRVVCRLEELYQITNPDGSPESISSLLDNVINKTVSMSEEALRRKNLEASSVLSILCLHKEILEFMSIKLVNRTLQKHITKDFMRALRSYSSHSTLNKETREDAIHAEAVLGAIENENPLYTGSLDYKLIRLFLVLCCYRNYVASSIIGKILLDQIGGD